MSRDAFRDFDARIHAALAAFPGLRAESGMYTAPGSNQAFPCNLYFDEGQQVLGDYNQITGSRDEMRILQGTNLDLRQGGQVFIEGVPGSGIGETWKLDKSLGIEDGSLSGWVVKRV